MLFHATLINNSISWGIKSIFLLSGGKSMRALIRAKLNPPEHFNSLWHNRVEFDKAVADLFQDMEFGPEITGQEAIINDSIAQKIIQDIPEDIKEQETKHLILLGYSGLGQAHFIVSGVNPTEIHIRIKGGLFGRIERSCRDITDKSLKLKKSRQKSPPFFLSKNSEGTYLTLSPVIDVLEPTRDTPTITGEVIEAPMSEVIRKSRNEVALIIFTFLGALFLFFLTPTLAPGVQKFLSGLVSPAYAQGYTLIYVQGALERTYSAFLVTFSVSVIGLLTKIFELWRLKPVKWIMDIESKNNR
jgi:hypothetical protein